MRPIRLELLGFAAFREPVELDFENVDFFALVGPTGSGKSTVIDAICFALYGCVPRYEDNRRVGFVVTTGASEARVSLTFDLGTERYVATRVVRRKVDGGASTKEARLERCLDSGQTEVLAGTAPELDKVVVDLLGLPFNHFTRCVVLPQGEFARFLNDKPSQRQELLVNLLNLKIYERVGVRARDLGVQLATSSDRDERRISDLSFATLEAKDAAKSRVTELASLRMDLDKARPLIERIEKNTLAFRDEAVIAGQLVTSLRKIAVPANVIVLASQAAEKRDYLASQEKELEKSELEVNQIANLAKSKPKIASLQIALQAHEELESCCASLDKMKAALKAARSAEEQQTAKAATAQRAVDSARAVVEQCESEHKAHVFAKSLKPGAPCPVCQQIVAALPKQKIPGALREAKSAMKKADTAFCEATTKRERASQNRAGAESAVKELESRRVTLAKQVAAHPNKIKLGELSSEVEEIETALENARTGASELRDIVTNLREQINSIDTKLRRSDETFSHQRDAVVSLKPPAPKRMDLAADWQALAAWATKELPVQAKRAERAEAQAKDSDAKQGAQLERLRNRCDAADIPVKTGSTTLSVLSDSIMAGELEAKARLKEITSAIAEAEGLKVQVRSAREQAAVARMLGQLLSSKGFEQWLMAQAMQRLAEGASGTLQQLSSGQYSLCCDEKGEFLVVDHRNADETRSAKTLSGGETFQASLALALSLADQLVQLASKGAASLEAMFLDEGFGTLDTDALVTVGDTIENLKAKERMVGIVTHVPDLAERVPVRYVVKKGPRTSTVERVFT